MHASHVIFSTCLYCQPLPLYFKVYIIPQDQGESPLEVKSMAPDQRRGGMIGEIPGRKRPSSSRGGGILLDLPDKLPVESIKRAVKELPRGFPEVSRLLSLLKAAITSTFTMTRGTVQYIPHQTAWMVRSYKR